MKTLYSLAALSVLAFASCKQAEPVQILSVSLFKPLEPGKVADAADLIALKAYVDGVYDPDGRAALVSGDGLEEIGYSCRYWANQALGTASENLFDQGIQTRFNDVQGVVVGKIKPTENGWYELSVYAGPQDTKQDGEKFVKANFSKSSAGTMKLADGWIAAWSAKPQKG